MNNQIDNQTTTLPQDYQQLLEKLKQKTDPQYQNPESTNFVNFNNPSQVSNSSFEDSSLNTVSEETKETPEEIEKESFESQPWQTTPQPPSQEDFSSYLPPKETFSPENQEEKEEEKEEKKILDSSASAQARQLAEKLAEDLKKIEELAANKKLLEKELEALQKKNEELEKQIALNQEEVTKITEEINKIIK